MRRPQLSGRVILGGLLALGALAGSVSAAPPTPPADDQQKVCPICGRAGDANASYGAKAVSTLGRGATNALLGWTEMIRRPAKDVKAGGNVLTGIAHGVGSGVTRTLAGLGEVLTFWTPKTQQGYVQFSKDCPVCMEQ